MQSPSRTLSQQRRLVEPHSSDMKPHSSRLAEKGQPFSALGIVYERPGDRNSFKENRLYAGISKPLRQAHQGFMRVISIEEGQFIVTEHYGMDLQRLLSFDATLIYGTSHKEDVNAVTPTHCYGERGMRGIHTLDRAASMRCRFIIFQVLSALAHVHDSHQSAYVGLTSLDSVKLTPRLWVRLPPPSLLEFGKGARTRLGKDLDLHLTQAWVNREISNLDYLLAINEAVGRRMGDANCSPTLPWVTDFSPSESGNVEYPWRFRDLTRSKFFLKKGAQQLDFTFKHSLPPHHVPENLSDMTYYIYMARVTPIQVLRSVVRSNFRAKEYPSSMEHLYRWTPDECCPEFYLDPRIFASTHGDAMSDLKFPKGIDSAEDFIRLHRKYLESDEVSDWLHVWIDLNFGYLLTGQAAIDARNVPLNLAHEAAEGVSKHCGESAGSTDVVREFRSGSGFAQLFKEPHPERKRSKTSLAMDPCGVKGRGLESTGSMQFLTPPRRSSNLLTTSPATHSPHSAQSSKSGSHGSSPFDVLRSKGASVHVPDVVGPKSPRESTLLISSLDSPQQPEES